MLHHHLRLILLLIFLPLSQVLAVLKSQVDWSVQQVFGDVQDEVAPGIRKLCSEGGGGCGGGGGGGSVEWETFAEVFILENEQDLPEDVDLPAGVEVRPLGREHAEVVVGNWEFALEHTADRAAVMFDLGLCYGTFHEGELASWICTMR